MIVEFICGCRTGDITGRESLATMALTTFDEEGFLICVVHHQRRKGWRSLPLLTAYNKEGQPLITRADYSFCKFSELEIEKFMVFGEEPQRVQIMDLTNEIVDPTAFKGWRNATAMHEAEGLKFLQTRQPLAIEAIEADQAADRARESNGRDHLEYQRQLAMGNK